jgi:hypothetical protein
MRTRNEIENKVDTEIGKWSHNHILIIELLLDIRDLLNKKKVKKK